MTERSIAGVEITDDLVRQLLREHAPDFAEYEIGRYYWLAPHHVTIRLGDDYAVRIQREGFDAAAYEESLTALRTLSADWPVKVQLPVLQVGPSDVLPVPWEVVPWYDGATASRAPLSALGAVELGMALREMHQPAPEHAPRHARASAPLAERTADFTAALAAAEASAAAEGMRLDVAHCTDVWNKAVEAPVDVAPAWVHGSLDPQYVIVNDGHLEAIIEWHFFGAGDPAVDLGAAAIMCDPEAAERMLSVYDPNLSPATYARARGMCVLHAARLASSDAPEVAALGWDRLQQLHVAAPDA